MLYYYWPNKRQSCMDTYRRGVAPEGISIERQLSGKGLYSCELWVREWPFPLSLARTHTEHSLKRAAFRIYTLTRPALSIIWILHGPGFIMTRNKTIVVLLRRARDNQANKSAFARENTKVSNKIMKRRWAKKRVIKSEFQLPDDTFPRLYTQNHAIFIYAAQTQDITHGQGADSRSV